MLNISIGKAVVTASKVALVSFAGLFTYFTLTIYLKRRKYRHIPGPPSKGLWGFFTGNLSDLVQGTKEGKILSDLQAEWVAKYGNVTKFQVFNNFLLFTVEPEAVKEILITRNFPKQKYVYKLFGYPFKTRWLGRGLVTEVDNERWKHRRAMFNPGFHRQELMTFSKEFNAIGDILMDKLRSLADGKTMITLFEELNHATLDVIAVIAFGLEVNSVMDPTNNLNHLITESLEGFNKIMYDPFIDYKPTQWSYIRQLRKKIKQLRDIGRDQILKRIKLLEEGAYVPNDLLNSFIKAHQGENFDIEDLIDDFVTFFIAGQETTANTLAFCVMALGRNPEALAKLRKELDSVLGSRTEINFDDLNELPYTACVIKESLRLWPPVPQLSRQTEGKFSINGIDIPDGSWIQVGSFISGRCEQFFPNHMEFNPDRFEKDAENKQNYTFFPFSLGPRNCIGQNFAMMEAKILLAKFVQNFDFELDQNQNFGVKQKTTIRPADDVRLVLTIRGN